jgi:hypothetical protein
MKAALEIARRMRGANDGAVEDATRAHVMLNGMPYSQFDGLDVVSYSHQEAGRQLAMYEAGVQELQALFPFDPNRDHFHN